MVDQLIEVINDYFDRHAELIKKHGRLICCSDIIESIFGRYKNKGGMKVISADVLAFPLYAMTIDVNFVIEGLTTVSQKQVNQWHESHTCDNRYRILRRLKTPPEAATAAA